MIKEEPAKLLGSGRYERTEERRGYRNGSSPRTITTELGSREVTVPRTRVVDASGQTREFHSEILPCYAADQACR